MSGWETQLFSVQTFLGSAFNPDSDVSSDCLMLGTEVDLQQVENSVFAVEMALKAWLQEQSGDREHLHLLLPGPPDNPAPGTGRGLRHPLSFTRLSRSHGDVGGTFQ